MAVGQLVYWINENITLDLARSPWSLEETAGVLTAAT
jgi:hypothetical protein